MAFAAAAFPRVEVLVYSSVHTSTLICHLSSRGQPVDGERVAVTPRQPYSSKQSNGIQTGKAEERVQKAVWSIAYGLALAGSSVDIWDQLDRDGKRRDGLAAELRAHDDPKVPLTICRAGGD